MLTYLVIVPIVIAVFLYLFPWEKAARIGAILAQTGLVGAAFYLFQITRERDVIVAIGHFEDIMGIILRADALSSVFILLTAFIFLLVVLYSFSAEKSRLFWFLLFIWEGSLIGVFLTWDLFNIFVLMEVMTVVVAILIMYDRDNRSMYDGIIYLMVNVIVIQFYLLGLGYIYRLIGVLDIEAAAAAVQYLDSRQLALPYALMMTFVALKCALLPLYSWLPKAHSTPGATPAVSAVLSGLHIKGGVFLFIRLHRIFEPVSVSWFFLVLGLTTAAVGVILALTQSNIKKILAYSTVAQVGLIIAGLSMGAVHNYMGSLYHAINHALFKGALFLFAGMVIKVYGTKDVNKIRGVLKRMPLMGFAAVLAILGMVGMPLFNASISKYFMMYDVGPLLNGVMTVINLGTIVIFMKFSAILFGNSEGESVKFCFLQQVSVLTLGILCLLFGVFGQQLIWILFGWEAQVNLYGYLEKSAIFAVSVVVGYFIYQKMIKGRTFFQFDMGFRGMCAAMGVFFGLILVVVLNF